MSEPEDWAREAAEDEYYERLGKEYFDGNWSSLLSETTRELVIEAASRQRAETRDVSRRSLELDVFSPQSSGNAGLMENDRMPKPYSLYRCPEGHERRSYAAFGVDVTGAPPMQSMVWCVEKMDDGSMCKERAVFVETVKDE